MKRQILKEKSRFFVFSFILIGLLFSYGCKDDNSGNGNGNGNGDGDGDGYNPVAYTNVPEARDVVMYEVNPRVFASEGALKVVTERLDEIKALGTNVIWLMPIYKQGEGPQNVKEGRGSPYCIKDYKAVNPEYGTLEDLRTLVEEAHKREIAVILDLVANHTSWDNEWINNPGWYTTDSNGNIIHPEGTDWTDVADLNFDNADMRAAMIDAMKYWFTAANIDGFRCDAADYVPADFWEDANQELRKANSDRRILMLAEGNKKDYLTLGFDMDYGWNFYNRLKRLYDSSSTYSFSSFYNSYINEGKEGKMQIHFTTNHDESAWDETPIVLFHGERGSMSAFVVSTMLGGTPLIYSTQEIGREQKVPFFSCTTIDWNSNPDILDEYKRIMKIYTASDLFSRGTPQSYKDAANTACFSKSKDGKTILVVTNPWDDEITFTAPEEFVGTTMLNLMDSTSITLQATMEIPSYQYYILEKQ